MSVGETPALPVGDSVVMRMIVRRTGHPLRQHLKMFGADPFFLANGVVPVPAQDTDGRTLVLDPT